MATASPHNVGFLGLGLMGQRMLRAMASHPRFNVVIGFDPAPDPDAIAGAHGKPLRLGTEAEVLAACDVVYVASPPSHHVAQAVAALDAGRAVFCEKPLSVSVADADTLVARAEATGLPHAVNFPFATLPGLDRIEGEIADGTAGSAVRIEVELHFGQWPRSWHHAGAWLAGPDEGGFLREVFSHFAYLTQRLAGPMTINCSHVIRDAGCTETSAVAHLSAGDTPVLLTGGVGGAAPDYCRLTWYGTRRCYRLLDWSRIEVATESEPFAPWPDATTAPRGHDQLDALDACLSGRPHRLPSFADARAVMNIVEGLLLQTPQI